MPRAAGTDGGAPEGMPVLTAGGHRGPGPAGRSEVLSQSVLDEGVGEVETSRPIRQLPHKGGLGGRFEHVQDVVFGGVRRRGQQLQIEVPADHLIGVEGKGLSIALGTLERTRLGAAAQAVTISSNLVTPTPT